jgi:RimJ/RimL family protein N-acetyltransferase
VRAPVAVVLAGERLRLEPLEEHHHADLADAVAADPGAFTVSGPVPTAGLDAWLARAYIEWDAGARLPFAVVVAETGQAVGSSSYLDIAPADGRIEIGATWYGRPWWGTFVNPEAKLLLIGHAFDVLGATRVAFRMDAANARSRAAVERLGAAFEGVHRNREHRPDGSLRDTAYYSILPAEWPAVRSGLEARLAETDAGLGVDGRADRH